MTKRDMEPMSDGELDGIAGGGGKLSAHDLKKIAQAKPNPGNSPTPVPEKDPGKPKPKG
jgi:hypothetical protein